LSTKNGLNPHLFLRPNTGALKLSAYGVLSGVSLQGGWRCLVQDPELVGTPGTNDIFRSLSKNFSAYLLKYLRTVETNPESENQPLAMNRFFRI
jgi:hypothetical protein